ncbi:glycosyl hydrolase 115 family protein [Streptomyces sp. DSM 41886]|uniref:Glycosyl hydrolase 115 family protein n=1 Tax=Streptomyces johnsoniae TaxID=3075532 RepID=A0ABU2S0B6_9ACTN|nr:glycosyl hydrolase 115 family protein [Streptomyces sp. DSM 41886]MDT0442407.1 glycosyl hydrolase 115 family protein [Streptomyces sp. DSM 41886]
MTSRRSFLSLLPLTVAATAVPTAAHAAPAVPTLTAAPATGGRGARGTFVSTSWRPGSLALVANGKAAPVLVSSRDHPGVLRVADDLAADIARVTGVAPDLMRDEVTGRHDEVVIVGTIGRSPLVDGLIEAGKLDVDGIAGRWETTRQQVVAHPLPGVRRAFVIAGSDQRGTIFGAYEASRQMGVSPWYWWDDVPAPTHTELYALPGRHTQGTPAVKYRGFFINDENPALGTWAPAFFGPGHAPGFPNGFNSAFFAKVFEVMLRLKANYLWPAVWGRAFAEDDPDNHATATAYGIVMGTSHEAPMMRGIEEWNRHAVPAVRDEDGNVVTPGTDPYGGTGEWSFRRNGEAIKQYWADGVRRMVEQDFEGVVTLGMRGNGDVSLPDGDGIDLMRSILESQRAILAEVTGADDLTAIPQVQTLYKEVQRYWDQGLRPPDDVTVIFCDDNWGNMRKVPERRLAERAGGYGLYYHFDYVGGGRNYKWVDTVNLASTWEQLHLSYRSGIDRLWVVNVGDLKAEEMPLQFFLDYAWDPERWTIDRLAEWERQYAEQSFGPRHAEAIAEVLHTYGVLQARRKPELLNRRITLDPAKDPATDSSAVVYDDRATPFSIEHYRELDRVTEAWERLDAETQRIGDELDAAHQDAYYQLVQYQVEATANLYALRHAEFTSLHYAAQGRAAANQMADATDARFADDQAMSDYYNNTLADGKWAGFQTQPKIGYGDIERYGPDAPWQQPQTPDHVALPDEVFPPVRRVELPEGPEMGVAIDGSALWWPAADTPARLPSFSPFQSQPAQYIEVFNRGAAPFAYRIEPAETWVTVTESSGTVETQVRAEVAVDFTAAPHGTTTVPITVTGPDGVRVEVLAVVENPDVPRRRLAGFIEANGYVSIEAAHHSRAVNTSGVRWQRIPDIGRTGDGMTPFPVTAARRTPGGRGPRLEYELTLFTTGEVRVYAYLSPRNNVLPTDGLSYAVSFDEAGPQTVNVTEVTGADDTAMNKQWERNTSDNVNLTVTTHTVAEPGRHVLKFWMVDPTVVLQKLVVDTGGLNPSYLGPPESTRARD